jgi:methionine synthase II (cobalamin-independent)
MTLCLTSSILAQSSGYNVSDYKPATLNDSYKPGQSIIFGNSGSAARAVSPQPASRTSSGNYRPLLPLLQKLNVGTLFLEFCTDRADEIELISELPQSMQIGVGVVNPKSPQIETLEQVMAKAQAAIDIVGVDRILLNADCRFATFADSPVASPEIAEAKLTVMVKAAAALGT